MKALVRQIFKFGVVGIVAFGIDYGILILLTEVIGINYLVSATISFSVSVVFNYIASMRFVFKRKDRSPKTKEFMIFVLLSIVGLVLNDLLIWLGVSFSFDYRLVKLVVTVIVMVYNFITRKLLLEERSEKQSS